MITSIQKARAEVARYSDEPSTQEDPLTWWKNNAFRYPLSSCSQEILAYTSYIGSFRASELLALLDTLYMLNMLLFSLIQSIC